MNRIRYLARLALIAAVFAFASVTITDPASSRAATWADETGGSFDADGWDLAPTRVDPAGNYFISMGEDGSIRKALDRFQVRAPGAAGGYVGPLQVPSFGSIEDVDFGFDSSGVSWWIEATGSAVKITRRGAGPAGGFGAPETLATGSDLDRAAVGVAPNGDVLAVWSVFSGSSGNGIFSSFKAANQSSFPSPAPVLTGTDLASELRAVLDSSGSGLVLYSEVGPGVISLKQRIRSTGGGFSAGPTIQANHNQLYWDSGIGGYAAIAYKQLDQNGKADLFASTRAPGDSFSAGNMVNGDKAVRVDEVSISVAPDGNAAVAWEEALGCPGSTAHLARYSRTGPGGQFGPAQTLASSNNAIFHEPSIGVAGADEWVAGWSQHNVTQAGPCGSVNSVDHQVKLSSSEGSSGTTSTSLLAKRVQSAAAKTSSGFEALIVWFESNSLSDNVLHGSYLNEQTSTDPDPDPDPDGGTACKRAKAALKKAKRKLSSNKKKLKKARKRGSVKKIKRAKKQVKKSKSTKRRKQKAKRKAC